MDNVTKLRALHRGAARPSIPHAHLSLGEPRQTWAESLQVERPTTLERVTAALGSDRIIPLYLAFLSGSLFTLAMAIVWNVVLS